MSIPVTVGSTAGAARFSGYRPWLDGVRAVAILLVLLEHTNLFKQYNLGGVGVGIFFALSGYLITGLLWDEFAREGRLALLPFYIRRFARLAPALLLVALIAGLAFVLEGQRRAAFNAIFAVTYTTNYAAIFSGHHLAGFGHTWSLAVEEHFYLIWPPLMLLLMRRIPAASFVKAVLAIAVMVLCWRAFLFGVFGEQVRLMLYAGSIERLDSLLYGCAAAVAVRQGWRPGNGAMAAGVVALAVSVLWIAPLSSVFGPTLIGAGGALFIAAIDCERRAVLQQVLSTKLMVRTGILSYGIYLWHIPLLQLSSKNGEGSLPSILAAMALAVILAHLSYRYCEVPIRDSVRQRLAQKKEPALT
ncbi:acyltransferase family protein [Herbaspirillum rubrisubalbicans]|uniref:acyltransferase family protein n=1 Tax=Herbaspirillum rubrisubalbicans TaxID=80842 RepID=UPI0015590506|nr:acyltransferase [Herbaspirillum rubrisubalbicans]NQE50431.1 hypothetical protein [Herbaspirillum rubrisubalbicans]